MFNPANLVELRASGMAVDGSNPSAPTKMSERIHQCRPCPCCGNKNLYVGPTSFDNMGVKCMAGAEDFVICALIRSKQMDVEELDRPDMKGCGLELSVPLPNEYPDTLLKGLVGRDALDKLRDLTLEEAIRRWNRRFEK